MRRHTASVEREQALNDLHAVIADLRDEIGEVRRAQAEPSQWLERVLTKKVLFHLVNDSSIEGLLVSNLADGVVLRAAELLNSGAQPTQMAGEVFIPRERIALAQLGG